MTRIKDNVSSNEQSGNEQSGSNTPVRVMLCWTATTLHTGFIVAKALHLYEENNLDVDIITPDMDNYSIDTSVRDLVEAGTIDFGISYQDCVTFARAKQMPIVAVAAIIQHNTSGFASPASSNIRTPKDFIGKKYGAFVDPAEEAIMTKLLAPYGRTARDVTFVPAGMQDFFQGTQQNLFDFSWVYEGWTGMEARVKGIDLNYIALRDIDPAFDYYTPVLITSETYLKNCNATARTFVKAVKEGYEWAIAHPEDAAVILHKYDNRLDPALLEKSMEYLVPKFQEDASEWGVMKDVVWERYTKWLQDNGFIDSSFTIEGAYTNTLLQ